MRSPEVIHAVLHRLQRRSTWVAALLFGAAWLGLRAAMGVPFEGFGLGETVIPLALLVGTLLIGPVPWQWTGDEAPLAPFLRGLVQALPWNAAWIFLTLALLLGLGVPVGPRAGLLAAPGPAEGELRPGGPEGLPPPLREGLRPPRPHWDRPLRPRPLHRPGPFTVGLVNLPLVLLLGWFLADRERTESSERRFQRLAQEARNASLQAQLHPHVLFNALSGLTELVHEDPDAAEEALLELSRLLRLLLSQGNQPRLPLREERALIRSYLTLEKIRMGAQLRVTWAWAEALDGLQVPPLLVLPLVENAITHGLAQHPGGGELQIRADREGGVLHVRVANPGPEASGAQGYGLGHGPLRERLAMMQPPGRFRLGREGDLTVAELWLPVPEQP